MILQVLASSIIRRSANKLQRPEITSMEVVEPTTLSTCVIAKETTDSRPKRPLAMFNSSRNFSVIVEISAGVKMLLTGYRASVQAGVDENVLVSSRRRLVVQKYQPHSYVLWSKSPPDSYRLPGHWRQSRQSRDSSSETIR
jgi:hypothetical protein